MEYALDEFLEPRIKDPAKHPRNQYVTFPGWKSLYVRVNPRYFNGKVWPMVIDLANIEAEEYGKGTFRALVKHLRSTYPNVGLYVEQVQTERFRLALPRMGFVPRSDNPLCFFLEPK